MRQRQSGSRGHQEVAEDSEEVLKKARSQKSVTREGGCSRLLRVLKN